MTSWTAARYSCLLTTNQLRAHIIVDPSRALFELIVKLYKLQMKYNFILHMAWITGARMIHQGTDGLSRGDTNGLATSGVSLSIPVLLHLSATKRAPKLLEWIKDWEELSYL
jgi:hypothetical protein